MALQTEHPTSSVARRAFEVLTALSMTVGRGAAARTVADLAGVGPGDRVVDLGCGPGTAVREALRRGAGATGVDPSPVMLGLARRITSARGLRNATWVEGTAEAVPAPDGSATVVWALSSVHHWHDRGAGLAEARRVLAPGGRVVLAERLTRDGARGHAAHGLTRDEAEQLASAMAGTGFLDVHVSTERAGRRTLVVVRGTRSATP